MANSNGAGFSQEKFDAALGGLLKRLPEDKIPNTLNKKGLRIAFAALAETPMTNPFKILFELKRVTTLRREDGSTSQAPIGYGMAAQRASKTWTKRKRSKTQAAWQKLVGKTFNSMVGRRRASRGFIKSGWVSVIKVLSPLVRGTVGVRASSADTRTLRGSLKGSANPATAGWSPRVTIENTAASRSDRGGFERVGAPALQRAFDRETADIVEYLEREALKEETEKFNAANK